MTSYSAGDAFISILPSFKGFAQRLKRELAGVRVEFDVPVRLNVDSRGLAALREVIRTLPSIVVDANTTPAEAAIAALRERLSRLSDQTVGVTVSGDAAASEIDSIRSDLQRLGREAPEIAVRVDAGAAEAQLAGVQREAAHLDGRRVNMRVIVDAGQAIASVASVALAINTFANKEYKFSVQADVAGASAAIAGLIAKVSGLAGLGGVVGGFGGALGGLGAAGAVAAGGLGATLLASLGVGKALTALSAKQDGAAASATASAKQQQSAANGIASAQDRVKQASQSADRARADGARSVADATKSSSKQVESALKSQAQAQKSLRQATADLKREQSTLTDAWEAGRRSLEDLQQQVRGNAIDVRQAVIDVADAAKDLADAQRVGDPTEIDKATVAYDRQKATLDELMVQRGRLAEDNSKAQAKGVAGSDQVVSANDRISQAVQRLADAQSSAKDADAAVTQARVDGADQVARAQEQASQRIADADHSVAESQRALAQAMAQTGDAGQSAVDKVTSAFADLSPAAATFAKFLFGLKPVLQDLSGVAATAFFPPLQAGITQLLTTLPLIKTVVGQLAGAMGTGLQQVLTTLTNPFWQSFFTLLGNSAAAIIPQLFSSLMILAQAGATLLKLFLPLAPAAFALLNQFSGLVTALAPFLVQLLGGLIPAASAFLTALTPLGPVLGALQPILLVLGQALSTVLGAVLTALAPILVALTPLIQMFAQQLAQSLVGAIQTLMPLLLAVATWMGQNPALVIGVVSALLGLAGAIKPVMWGLGLLVTFFSHLLIIKVAQAALRAFGLEGSLVGRAVMLLLRPFSLLKMLMPFISRGIMMIGRALLGAIGPIGWIITGLSLLYSSNEQFRNSINGVLGVLMGLVMTLVQALMPAFESVMAALMPLMGVFTSAFVPIIGIVAGVLVDLVNTVMPPLVTIITTVIIPVITMLANILSTVLVWIIQNVVVPAIQFLAWVLTNVVGPAVIGFWTTFVKPAFTAIGAIVVWIFQNVLKPQFDVIVWILKNILGPAFMWLWHNVVEPAFRGLGAAISWVWTNVIKPSWDALMGGLTWLRNGFNDAVNWIGSKWDGLKSLLAKPINFLIGTVFNNGIRKAWNFAAGLLPGVEPVNPLPLIPEYAAGGLLRGPGTGTSDSILGVNAAGLPIARVSNDEFVVRAAVTKQVLPFLHALNAGDGEAMQAAGLHRVAKAYRGPTSGIPAYAAGGPIEERIAAAKQWLSSDARGIPYVWGGGSRGGMDCSGMQAAVTHILSGRSPYSGRIGTTASMPWGGFVPGLNGAYAIGNKPSDHMAGTLAGQNVEQHGPAGTPFQFPSRWGADNGYFSQQFHLQQLGGGFVSGGSGGGGGMSFILDQIRGFFDATTDPLINGVRAVMGAAPPKYRDIPPNLATTARDKVRDFLFGQAETMGGGDGVDVTGISGPVRDQVQQVAQRFGWGTGPEWDAIVKLVAKESGWNPNAANPTTSARGLFQKMTSLHGPVEATAAGQAGWGLNYIRGRYGDPIAAWAFHQQHNSYDQGGVGQGIGWMWKGTGLDERVLPPQETQAYPTLTRLAQQIEAGRLPVPAGVSGQQYAAALSGAGSQPAGDTFHITARDTHAEDRIAAEVQRQRDFRRRTH